MNPLLPTPESGGLNQTRSSLLGRLRHWEDSRAWTEFFETYWRFIYRCALKAGLTDHEAEEVVQETMVTVAKKFRAGQFHHNRDLATFRTWLCRILRYMVLRVHRGRHTRRNRIADVDSARQDDDESFLDQVSDERDPHEAEVEREWMQNLIDVAAERVKQRVNPAHYQIFACRLLHGRSVTETARDLGVSVARVYLVTHRLSKLLREEFERLQQEPPALPTVTR